MSRKSANTFLAVIPLFDVDKHSAKHLRQFKYTCLTLIPSLLDSEDFVSKVSATVLGWKVGSSMARVGGGGGSRAGFKCMSGICIKMIPVCTLLKKLANLKYSVLYTCISLL